MGEQRYGAETPDGHLVRDVCEASEIDALRECAKVIHDSRSAGAVGKLMLAGYKVVKVKLVKEDE